MAPKKSKQGKSPSTPMADVLKMIKEFNIPYSVHIYPIIEDKVRRWEGEGLGVSVLVLGKRHIETLRFPIHHLILQFALLTKSTLCNSLQIP